MSKEQIVSDALSAISSGQAQVLQDAISNAVDQSAQEQKASDGTLTQEDLDSAVKTATDPLNAQIAQDKTDLDAAHAEAQEKLDAVNAELQSVKDDDSVKTSKLAALSNSVDAMQTALDAIKALKEQV